MKPYILALMAALMAVPYATAQNKVFSGGVQVDCNTGSDQQSKVYEMKGPYMLRWDLMDVPPPKKQDPYWKPRLTSDRNPPWISVSVYDATTRKMITHESMEGRQNQMQVSAGGKHYLVVTSYDDLKWTIWAKDGVLTATGERKLTAADVGGGTVQDALATLTEALRGKYTGSDLESRLSGAQLIASRSSSAADFKERWTQYSRAQGW